MANKVEQVKDSVGGKRRRELVPFGELSKTAQVKRALNLVLEGLLLAIAIGYGIYFLVIGDPNNRLMSCVGLGASAIMPIIIERLGKGRFTFVQHIIYDVYIFLVMYLGSVLYLHHTFAPFDEISHFIFGYLSCIAVFYGLMYSDAVDKRKVMSSCVIIFLVSMGIAAIWELMEFSMDLLAGEHSLGFPEQGIMEYIEESGVVGIQQNILSLRYTSVLDTVTDMAIHVAGSILFVIQYLIHRLGRRNVLLGSMTREVKANVMNIKAGDTTIKVIDTPPEDNANNPEVKDNILEKEDTL